MITPTIFARPYLSPINLECDIFRAYSLLNGFSYSNEDKLEAGVLFSEIQRKSAAF